MKTVEPTVRTITSMKIDDLLLDAQNYRFHRKNGYTQRQLIEMLESEYELETIGESLADNGYFPEEPLVAISNGTGKFVVIEGNRRLAALKLLLDPETRRWSVNKELWARLAARIQHPISTVPVIVYENRKQLTTFIGYRHIAGVIPWNPLPKARFISELVDKTADFDEVAKGIGTRPSTVRTNYIAYKILDQAVSFGIDTSQLEKNFGVFFRALSSAPIINYIGLRKNQAPSELNKPIHAKKRDELADVISFIHGSKSEPPVITDSRQLTKLGEILSNERATRVLKTTRDFAKAYTLSGGEERRLLDNLENASVYLDEVLIDLHRHKTNAKVISLIARIEGTLREIMKYFPKLKAK